MLSQEEICRMAEEIVNDFHGRKESGSRSEIQIPEGQPASKTEAAALEAARQKAIKDLEEMVGGVHHEKKEEEPLKEPDRRAPLVENPEDPDALRRMMTKTTARIGVGKTGPRLKTQTLLKLRADHAAAKDAVMMDVSETLIQELNLLPVVTRCADKNTFLTRPDLGRDFDEDTRKFISEKCVHHPDVQIIVSDGLSSSAIEANVARILPVVTEGLKEKGIRVGTPIFVKYGRVAAQDRISELLDAKVVCSFIGERPGLATAESMSAYISYAAEVGMPEARRTVVSNIHKDGVPAVEAGAYIVDLLALILDKKASGVDLKK